MKSEYTANHYLGVDTAPTAAEDVAVWAAFIKNHQRYAERLASQHFSFGYDPYNSADRFIKADAFRIHDVVYINPRNLPVLGAGPLPPEVP